MSSSCATRAPRRPHHQRPALVAGDAPDVRAGDPERERTASRLGLAFTQGYLSMDEYEARLSQAFAAQNTGALTQLTDDLPITQISRRDPSRRTARRAAARDRLLAKHLRHRVRFGPVCHRQVPAGAPRRGRCHHVQQTHQHHRIGRERRLPRDDHRARDHALRIAAAGRGQLRTTGADEKQGERRDQGE